MSAVGHVGALASTIISGGLIDVHLKLPFLVNTCMFICGALVALTLHVETAGKPIDVESVIYFEEAVEDDPKSPRLPNVEDHSFMDS